MVPVSSPKVVSCNVYRWAPSSLGIINPTRNNTSHYQSSESIMAPLVSLILEQSHQESKAQLRVKKEAAKQRIESELAEETQLEGNLASNVKRAMQVAPEKGASSWLATLPIAEHMDLLSTRVHSEMPFAYDMAGDLPIYHLTASVANTSKMSMH